MEGQETLDRAFGVTPKERELLRQGTIPGPLLTRLRQLSGAGGGNWIGPALVGCLLAGVWVGLDTSASRPRWTFALLLVPVAALVVQLRRWRRGRSAVAAGAPVRILEGPVETLRSWWFGYGETYYLWAALKLVGRPDEPFQLFTTLGTLTITGWARVYVVRVRDLDRVVAVEVGEQTSLLEREPARSPPTEPYGVGIPAD